MRHGWHNLLLLSKGFECPNCINQRLDGLVTNAAKAGAEMETGFKRKIFDASQVVNGFTEKILAQKR